MHDRQSTRSIDISKLVLIQNSVNPIARRACLFYSSQPANVPIRERNEVPSSENSGFSYLTQDFDQLVNSLDAHSLTL